MRIICFLAIFCFLTSFTFDKPSQAKLQDPDDITTRKIKRVVGANPQEINSNQDVQLWAIVIGISNFKNGDANKTSGNIGNLRCAADDAQAMHDFLMRPEGGGFRDIADGGRMRLLKNDQATKTNIDAALAMLKQSKPNDYFVIFIASHGYVSPQINSTTGKNEEVPYFVLHDTDLENPNNTALRMTYIKELVSSIPAKKGLVLTDTCHSGGILLTDKRAIKPVERANSKYMDDMKQIEKGVGFISAADQTELAEEHPDLTNGVFTHYILQGLSGLADAPDIETRQKDGKITFAELKKYVTKEVAKKTNGRQNPQGQMTDYEGNNIPLAYVNYGKGAGKGDSHGGLVIRTPDFDGVEVAINGETFDKLDRITARTINLTPGQYTLTFSLGGTKKNIPVKVEPGTLKPIEVNLAFSEGTEDSILSEDENNVFFKEAKEPNKEAKKLLYEGVDKFNKQLYQEAINSFNHAIEVNNGNYIDALCYRGQAEAGLSKHGEAVKTFQEALTLRPSDYETKTLLASAKSLAGYNLEEVLKELQEVIERHPKFSTARVTFGDVILARGGNLRAAKIQLKQAIVNTPDNPAAHMILANVLMNINSINDQKEAIVEAQKALDLWDQLAQKKKSNTKALKSLSLSHLFFGGGRFENKLAIAETQYLLAKANILLLESLLAKADPSLTDLAVYTKPARTNIQECIKAAQTFLDKTRLALALDVSARIYYLEENVDKAMAEADLSLKTSATVPTLRDFADPYYTLYSVYYNKQQYATAAENLQKYISIYRTRATPEQIQILTEELQQVKRQADSNRKKK